MDWRKHRTVDLLLTMPASYVLPRRIVSDYCSPEGYWRLGTSRCVCHRPDPLSLGLSLAPGTQSGYMRSVNEPEVQRPSSSDCSEAADSSSGLRLTRSRSVLAKSSPTHSSDSPATEATA
jgi:hypothetical protein